MSGACRERGPPGAAQPYTRANLIFLGSLLMSLLHDLDVLGMEAGAGPRLGAPCCGEKTVGRRIWKWLTPSPGLAGVVPAPTSHKPLPQGREAGKWTAGSAGDCFGGLEAGPPSMEIAIMSCPRKKRRKKRPFPLCSLPKDLGLSSKCRTRL